VHLNCLFVIPLPDTLKTLLDVNVINVYQGQWILFFLILRLFPLTAQKDSAEFSGVANCAAIIEKWGRPLPLSNIKDKNCKDLLLKIATLCTLCKICKAHLFKS